MNSSGWKSTQQALILTAIALAALAWALPVRGAHDPCSPQELGSGSLGTGTAIEAGLCDGAGGNGAGGGDGDDDGDDAGGASCGDDALDALIKQYEGPPIQVRGGQGPRGLPSCQDFTQFRPQYTVGETGGSRIEVGGQLIKTKWALVVTLLPDFEAKWKLLAAAEQRKTPWKIESAYRSPAGNAKVPKASTNSQHMRGTALDIATEGATNAACTLQTPPALMIGACADYRRLHNGAIEAGLSLGTSVWMETWWPAKFPCQPGNSKCVHADLRNVAQLRFISP